ncbi:MAG: hypothetical protein ACXWUN_12975, partial [Allosphingosinicella sp.]
MRLVTLAAEDDFDGWRAAVRPLAAERVPPAEVSWQVGDAPTDLFAAAAAAPAAASLLPQASPADRSTQAGSTQAVTTTLVPTGAKSHSRLAS